MFILSLHNGLAALAIRAAESPFVTIITKITDAIKPAIVPAATLGLTFYFFFTFIAPFMGESVMNLKGYFMKAAIALVGYSMLGTFVVWLSTLAA